MCLVPSNVISLLQRFDSNCRPRSVVMVEGTPKRKIQVHRKAFATVSAVLSAIGIASGQRAYRYRSECTQSRWKVGGDPQGRCEHGPIEHLGLQKWQVVLLYVDELSIVDIIGKYVPRLDTRPHIAGSDETLGGSYSRMRQTVK